MDSIISARDVPHTPARVPRAGMVVNALLSMCTISVLAVCLTRRISTTKDFRRVPLTRWLLFAIYIDCIIFIVVTNVLANGFGVNLNREICSSTILLCLTCYLSSKVLIYYFLVEKVYIIRRVNTPRLKSKLYCFNCFGMLLPYCVVVVMNYIYRIAYLRDDGVCIIGMQKISMLPLIIFDAIVNLYLTMLFVIPLRGLYSYKNSPNSALRTIAVRSFFGALGTLTSSVANLTVLMVLKGEPAWVCLMLCNGDVLFSVLVLHWVTSKDSSTTATVHSLSHEMNNSRNHNNNTNGNNSAANGYGLGSRIQPTVTTHISASKNDPDGLSLDEEDIVSSDGRREKWEEKSTNGGYVMGKMRVQVGRVVNIESSENVAGGSSSTVVATKKVHSQSTEDLVERERRSGRS